MSEQVKMYDVEMADFILPRLRDYYHTINRIPFARIAVEYGIEDQSVLLDKWKETVLGMIHAFESTYEDSDLNLSEDCVAQGFHDFGRYFRCIW